MIEANITFHVNWIEMVISILKLNDTARRISDSVVVMC